MMSSPNLDGYSVLDKIYDGSRTLVYRGIRISDHTNVVIKLLKSAYPTFSELVHFRNQYTLTQHLNDAGIVRSYSLEHCDNGYALVMEDFGGISLSDYVKTYFHGVLPLSNFLPIAQQIVQTLAVLYQQRLIHKDIKPQNILINPHTLEVKLTDFSIASALPREVQELYSPETLEGTLAYMSPEQTGRMNRGIDYRTDFYSLGVTFYELLTGQLPFQSEDPLELIHAHVSLAPIALTQRMPALPTVINQLVLKLMAKNAEDRYQSAQGLMFDLDYCGQNYRQNAEALAAFELGQQDQCDRFVISEKLYGREAELQTLLTAFDRIASPASDRLILISGASGVGKTAVIKEIHKPIAQSRGYFVQGKFDQFNRIPFSALVQAFRQLVTQLLTEDDALIATWRSQLQKALGENGRLLTNVIPELEEIIGVQPAVAELSAEAAQNRFNQLLERFIYGFTRVDRPLVIFLDDLQWADLASLKLLKQLACEPLTGEQVPQILFIGAYRDHEFMPLMDDLQQAAQRIYLQPLTADHLTQWIADTLNCDVERSRPLAQLVHQKTSGNPFFSTQLLKSFYQEGLIHHERGGWECDIAQIQAMTVTDDVVEFMVTQLCKLPAATQLVLKLAACIGNQFDLKTLAIIAEKSEAETAADLWPALDEGFVLPRNESYKFFLRNSLGKLRVDEALNQHETIVYRFLHDRIQQAAYALITATDRPLTHLKIGRLLWQNVPATEQLERIFEIANALNLGAELMTERAERDALAKLNLTAGQKAKSATAYGAAMNYFRGGIQLLSAESWQAQYQFTLSLHEEYAEASFLNSQWQDLEQAIQTVLQNARNLYDTVKIYDIQLLALIGQNKLLDAIALGLSVLRELGVQFPVDLQPAHVQAEMDLIADRLPTQPIALLDLPFMTDANALAAMNILSRLSTAAFKAAPELASLVALKQIELSIQYGNTGLSGFAYAWYGLMLCTAQSIERGYQFGQLAMRLVTKLNAQALKGKVLLMVNNFTRHWQEPVQATLPALREAYGSAIEAGDLEFAAYSGLVYSFHAYLTGKELTEVAQAMATYGHMMQKTQQSQALQLHLPFWQATLNWLGESDHPCCLTGMAGNEDAMLRSSRQANNREAIFYFYLNKLILCYSFENYELALKATRSASNYLAGGLPVAIFHFYDSLIQLAAEISPGEIESVMENVAANQTKLQCWAQQAPMNHLHKFELVEAERYRVRGEILAAMDAYDQAIALAIEHQYPHEAALANELAAKFYLAQNKPKVAQAYLFDAYYGYARWGAQAKVRDLEQRYPQLLASILHRHVEASPFTVHQSIHQSVHRTVTSTSSGSSLSLDLMSILKASQALSSEMELDQLLRLLMNVAVENAGADRGAILLRQGEQWNAVATYLEGLAHRLPNIPLEQIDVLPQSVIQWVKHTGKSVIVNQMNDLTFAADPYLVQQQPKSFLALPVFKQGHLMAILYLENRLLQGTFTSDRLEVLNLICAQAAISIENAKLYLDAQNYAHQLEQSQEQLLFDALHDALTGLHNRPWFIQQLSRAIAQTHQDATFQFAVLFLDLDLFKVVNDSLGHLVGDQLLKQVAQRVQTCLPQPHAIARLGGDEFAILIEGITDSTTPIGITRLIQTQLMQPFEVNHHEMVVGASMGMTMSAIGYQHPEEILRDVDTALYRAKAQGRGCYALFDPTMQDSAVERLKLENDLRRAIENLPHANQSELQIYYQPVISLITGNLSGFEALLRWQHPQQGWISPVKFIPIAEETGLIHALGWWVLRTACQQLRLWQQEHAHADTLVMNVNVSTLQLRQPDLVEQIQALLVETQLAPSSLKLEITESSILETFSGQATQLKRLKDLGIRLCIDDFGTGYSSLSRLHEFPVDTLKIDRAFVSRIDGELGGAEIVQTIIALASSLGMDSVAEGVETFAQLERLRNLHCEYGQGYYFSKPVDHLAAAEFVRQAQQNFCLENHVS